MKVNVNFKCFLNSFLGRYCLLFLSVIVCYFLSVVVCYFYQLLSVMMKLVLNRFRTVRGAVVGRLSQEIVDRKGGVVDHEPICDTVEREGSCLEPGEYRVVVAKCRSFARKMMFLEAVKKELETDIFHFYVGTSYRHCLIWENGEVVDLVQPHDVLGQKIGDKLPENEALRTMMKKSYDILVNHPINIERKKKGLNPANSCWFWGAGTKPALYPFTERTHKKGAMISAVDLLKGIAVGTSMKVLTVDGANGGRDTN